MLHKKRPAKAGKQFRPGGGGKRGKGVLQALRGCAAYGKQFHFTVVGSVANDAYVSKVKEEIRSLGLDEKVTLTGMVADKELQSLYRKADVFLMPSETSPDYFEGFGLVFLEANALGIPVIGPDESGTAEAIAEGISGYQVDVEDAGMIADRLRRILDEKSISPEACRKWAQDHAIDGVAAKTEAVYAQVMASETGRS